MLAELKRANFAAGLNKRRSKHLGKRKRQRDSSDDDELDLDDDELEDGQLGGWLPG